MIFRKIRFLVLCIGLSLLNLKLLESKSFIKVQDKVIKAAISFIEEPSFGEGFHLLSGQYKDQKLMCLINFAKNEDICVTTTTQFVDKMKLCFKAAIFEADSLYSLVEDVSGFEDVPNGYTLDYLTLDGTYYTFEYENKSRISKKVHEPPGGTAAHDVAKLCKKIRRQLQNNSFDEKALIQDMNAIIATHKP